MSIFDNLTDIDTVSEQSDSAPASSGAQYGPFPTDAYHMTIDMAYLDVSAGGAHNVNFVFKDAEGRIVRQTIYFTNRQGQGTYLDKKSGEARPLPGFTIANNLCLLASGDPLAVVGKEAEEKVLSLWDRTARKELPQKKHVLVDLLGKEIILGLQEVVDDKNVKNAQGEYVPSGETITINEINAVFRAVDRMSPKEIVGKAKEATALDNWITRNQGKQRIKSKIAKGGATPAPKAEPTNVATIAPKSSGSLFK